MLPVEDILAIHDLIARYGHLIDERQFSRTHELFTPDVDYDVSDFGTGVHHGIDAVRRLWEEAGDKHPLAHHATNVIVSEDPDGTVRVVSKGIGVRPGGLTGSVVYRDIVVKTAAGWRMKERIATLRRPDRIPAPT